MANFVLIHGAMHGGWCWERIVPLLESQGHHVIAPDLPGLGADKTPASQVTLEIWGKFIADILHKLPGRAILAGHSMGGMAISQAAEYASSQIAALVYVTALLPRNGLSAFEITRGDNVADNTARIELRPTADGEYITAAPESVREFLYGDTAEEWAGRALSLVVPQPLAVMQKAAKLSPAHFGVVPRAFIECLRDRVLPISLQRSMQATSPCGTVLEIDTDHSPFYSTPDVLAAHLIKIAAQYN